MAPSGTPVRTFIGELSIPPAHTSYSSPLLELPAELRNQIWELAATEDQETTNIASSPVPGWISACRQIRKEAMPLWLMSNAFPIELQSARSIKQIIAFENFCRRQLLAKKFNKMRVKITFAEGANFNFSPTEPTGSDTFLQWATHVRTVGSWRPQREDANGGHAVLLTALLELMEKTCRHDVKEVSELVNLFCWSFEEAQKHTQ